MSSIEVLAPRMGELVQQPPRSAARITDFLHEWHRASRRVFVQRAHPPAGVTGHGAPVERAADMGRTLTQ
jgi:hypothetical protein